MLGRLNNSLTAILLFSACFHVYGQTFYISGQQNGILDADTIYLTGNVSVPATDSLVFNPGTRVISTGHFGFDVEGRIMARGKKNNPVLFTMGDTTGFSDFLTERGGWCGFDFKNIVSATDSSVFTHCIFSYTKALRDSLNAFGGAFNINNFHKIRIQNCTFSNHYARLWGGAMFCESSDIIIDSCLFENNFCGQPDPPYGYGGAICFRYSAPKITNSRFISNHSTGIGGAVSLDFSDAFLQNNFFTENSSGLGGALGYIRSQPQQAVANNIFFRNNCTFFGGAVAFLRSNPLFIHNTLIENSSNSYGGGLYCNDSATPAIVNSIVYHNLAPVGHEVYIWDIYSAPAFYHCNIKGGMAEFGGTGGTAYSGDFVNNIDIDPKLIESAPYHCMLMEDSPCIDAGTVSFSGKTYPTLDFIGNPRISGSGPDIGAFEYRSNLGSGVFSSSSGYAVYPNPFYSGLNITVTRPPSSEVSLKIVNMTGSVILEKNFPVGMTEFNWDGKDSGGNATPPGLYLIRIQSRDTNHTSTVIRSR